MNTFDGQVAIVTGAGGGIGSVTGQFLAQQGASVVAADIDLDRAHDTVQQIRESGGKAEALYLDLKDESTIDALYAQTMHMFGRVDIVDNNAAALDADTARRDTTIASMDNEIWDMSFAVNVRGTMISCRNALAIMETQGSGVIINTASNLALQGNVIQAAYSASKAAVIQMTRSIATSHGKRGIRCNTVLPGLTASKAALEQLPEQLRDIVEEETLTPYLGLPQDIAEMVCFLASDAARYITGQCMVVDGGTSAHIPGVARLREFFATG